jgi:hypothetical protein
MQGREPQTDPGAAFVPNQPVDVAKAPAGTSAPPGAGGRIPLWILTLVAGLLAGFVSWLGGELIQRAFPVTYEVPAEIARMSGYEKSAKLSELEGEARRVAERKKTVATYGLLGALLGVALGLTGGWSRRSMRSGLGGAVAGGVIAMGAGAALSWVLVPVFYQLQHSAQAAQYAHPDATSGIFLIHFLIHAGICVGIGLASAVALGWGLGDWRSLGGVLIGGLFGAIAGGFLFETINSLAFPLMRADWLVPEESLPRLAMHLCVAGGTAVLAGLAVTSRRTRSSSAPSAS